MASHSGYHHLHLHHPPHTQQAPHLPPPPPSSVGQTPDLRLPSLRSLNFAYPPVGDPGSTTVDGMNQTQQRVDQPRATYAPPDEYYHQRDMPYYQDASSSSHPAPAQAPTKRARSTSNSGTRSPYAAQPSNTHHSQAPEAQTRTAAAGYAQAHLQGQAQGHVQGHAQGHPSQYSHPPQQQQQQHQVSESTQPPTYYNRPHQASPQTWYYPPAHQPSQQQPQHHQHPTAQHPQQQQQQHPQQQQQHQHHQQQQQRPPPPQNVPQKHPMHYQPYPPAPPSTHSPHQATQPRGPFSAPAAPSQQVAPTASPVAPVLAGPGTTAATGNGYNSSPPTVSYSSSTSSLSAATTNSRGMDAKALGEDAERAAAGGMHLSKIMEHSKVLCDFANHYAQMPHMRPSPAEVAEMSQRATLVLQLVDHLRRIASASGALPLTPSGALTSPNGERPYPSSISLGSERERDRDKEGDDKMDKTRMGSKKRPWEDAVSSEGPVEDGSAERSGEDMSFTPTFEGKNLSALRSVAEKDMAIIRSKRGQGNGAAGAASGAAKAKYRKRSRATPPGKCHSCNIRETPEWRRGPDGARTLCNACGLHYAKLIRKRDKILGEDGHADAPPIDLEMLRASTRLVGEPPKTAPSMHASDNTGFRDAGSGEMSEIQLQPVPVPVPVPVSSQRGLPPQMGVSMQVHQWTPPAPRGEGNYELAAYSTSLMRSSNARGSPG